MRDVVLPPRHGISLCAGGGIHPLAAGYAFRTLAAAHGLGRVGFGTTKAGDDEN